MTATNHVLTGALIVASVHNPLIALPAAFASHFVLDALPHYDLAVIKLNSTSYKIRLLSDIFLAALTLIILLVLQPTHVWLILAGGVLASSPDLMWLPDFIAANLKKPKPKYGIVRRFHHAIQYYAKPLGSIIELAWLVGMLILLRSTLVI